MKCVANGTIRKVNKENTESHSDVVIAYSHFKKGDGWKKPKPKPNPNPKVNSTQFT